VTGIHVARRPTDSLTMEIECGEESDLVPADRRIYAAYGGCLHKERYLQSIIICPESHALMLRIIASAEVREFEWVALHCLFDLRSVRRIDSLMAPFTSGPLPLLKTMTSQPIQVD
jgi:hypothetical protein